MPFAKSLIIFVVILVAGCTGVPEGIDPVSELDVKRYEGTWYEIARLDHSFEEGLSNVTADYAVQDDGSIQVINRGYSEEDGQWEEAEGRAVFVSDERNGHLKVSFFGPFYASYVVFGLDDDYEYAYITGYDRDYLWFLSKTPTVDDEALAAFREEAIAKGFDLEELIVVDQGRNR
ncbi:lipocalin family protein [Marinobacter sp. ATCH36]|uniref:lipocalin family protein n=1 Tax=Marinobacter sp. ATCH36 TaxID=2945106 RepID=UPI0020204307|nr:lipocalin family protein [Marinobacter sp. ATCH36]MCL7944805.1 lipocalin family protein [Marinobacter sp. ATCH36]